MRCPSAGASTLHPYKQFPRTTEQPRNVKRLSGPTFCVEGSPDEAIQHSVQLQKQPLWLWGLPHVLGEVVPVNDWSHCKKFLSYIEMKSSIKSLPRVPNKQPQFKCIDTSIFENCRSDELVVGHFFRVHSKWPFRKRWVCWPSCLF